MRIELINAPSAVAAPSPARLSTDEGGAPGQAMAAPAPAATPEDFERVERTFNDALEPYGLSLRFSRDEETGATVIRVVEQETGEVLKQIPREALLRLSAALGKLQGSLFERSA